MPDDVSPIDIAVLSSPVPPPGTDPRETFSDYSDGRPNFDQVANALTQGSGVVPPIGSGNETSILDAGDFDKSGANVGGLVKTSQEDEPMDLKYVTADEESDAAEVEEYEGLVDDYEEAYEDEGMRGARDVKAEDRQDDKTERQAAFDLEMRQARRLDGQAKRQAKKSARSKKRASRKDARKQRRSAFKEFKANR